MKAKYAGKCNVCGKRFPEGEEIWWDSETRKASHVWCANLPPGYPHAEGEWVPKKEDFFGRDEDVLCDWCGGPVEKDVTLAAVPDVVFCSLTCRDVWRVDPKNRR